MDLVKTHFHLMGLHLFQNQQPCSSSAPALSVLQGLEGKNSLRNKNCDPPKEKQGQLWPCLFLTVLLMSNNPVHIRP
jgi:hypothetical protein